MQRTVVKEQADVGIALDGDGDRVVMVDAKGELIDGDEIVYIIAKARLAKNLLQGGIVGTVMSNYGLELSIRELGLDFVRSQVGDRHVIAELMKRGWTLGGEGSGHIICLDNTTTGDGIITALQVLASMCTSELSLAELKSGMEKFPQITINVQTKNGREILSKPQVQTAVKAAEASLAGKGRVLLRPSGTEPVIRIMVEGQDQSNVEQLAAELAQVVEQTISGC